MGAGVSVEDGRVGEEKGVGGNSVATRRTGVTLQVGWSGCIGGEVRPVDASVSVEDGRVGEEKGMGGNSVATRRVGVTLRVGWSGCIGGEV